MDITKQLDEAIANDEEGVTGVIFQKNGEPYRAKDGSECTITVVGAESKRVRKAVEAIQRRILRPGHKTDPADIAQNRIDKASAAIISWHGWENGEEPAECTRENREQLLRAEHILDQAEAMIAAHGTLFKKPSR